MYRIALALSLFGAVAPTVTLAQRTDTIRVGARRVEVLRMGTGSPTLVLESGAGEGAAQWKGIIADLAQFTQVVAYSRSGHGQSSAAPGPGSPAASVAELHELLGTLKATGPVVLVGHSWGGLLARLYVSTYPSEVAGLVLVDGTHEAQFARWAPLNPAFKIVDSIRAIVPKLPPSARSDYEQLLAVMNAQHVSGMNALPASLPVAVITALKPCAPQREFTCRDPRALAVWRELHDEWFTQATSGIRIVSAKTEHYVMNDEPGLILQAARFVLDQTRSTKR
ncbi:alpha/beta fold hydrolase [Gemmatimonas sp.]|uniref:alpha/beta fold hydrolase n=1 Tax=Gemmatimonas sp. TaxID=1962908 RepID=UPI00333FD0CF